MTDQLRADCLGYAGHPDVKTPYLDTLASRGVIFDHTYSACPSCIAARAALHTGREQSHHGRVGYEDNQPWNYTHTMAGELSKAGYYTQCVGKMHVHPLRNYLGFHNVELHDGYLHCARYGSVPYRESQFVADDYFHWLKQELGTDADVTDTGLDCNGWVARPWTHEEKYHPTNWVTGRSIDFLRRRDPRIPFFLMASYLRPHPPFDAPRHYFDLYSGKDLRPPFVGSWETDEYLKRDGRIFDSYIFPHSLVSGISRCVMTVSVMYAPGAVDRHTHKETMLPKQTAPLIIQRKPIGLNRIKNTDPVPVKPFFQFQRLYIKINPAQGRLAALKGKTDLAHGLVHGLSDQILKRLLRHHPVRRCTPFLHFIAVEAVITSHITKTGNRFD